ncbi:hypothetical protein [Thiohalophilus thiocyanatoxydans]|uniref:Uncharacterized protein n=1 Tax=Thiohalophilus thiocyanatoxydans TaxID=381308 RepID=A0A4R8ING9_9GAMM|nr:hypothetical protein [Thiohalophilus thiocyanatoxydans]TDY01744.1 hypothetical protein EDC23_1635 [Thiohalophilus thiocyanatoxydans]
MTKPADKPAPGRKMFSTATLFTILYGCLSLGLYILLFVFNDEIRHMAEATSRGDKTLFFIPIIIALVFSLVHGAFTGYFWEALGLKAKKK